VYRAATKRIKSFCFFFQKEALSLLKKRNKKLLSVADAPAMVGP
jgi:hypothetical protein